MLAFEEKSLGMNHVRSGGAMFGLFYGVRKIGFEKRTMENYIIFACLCCLEVSLGFSRSWFEISEVWEIRVQVRSKLMKKTDFLAQSDLLWLAFLDLYVSDTAVFTQGRICPQFLEFIIYVSSNWKLSITHPSNPIMRVQDYYFLKKTKHSTVG